MTKFEIGDIVTGIYKTGKYIGEVTVVKEGRYVVRVLAVLKHPTQGDLHQPKSVEVPFFHERRALAFREQTNIPAPYVKTYEGEIPDYQESLKTALTDEMAKLKDDNSEWAKKSLQILESLKEDYLK
ncbi:kinase-associated lipoprotein B [Evansella sp. AB-rgal1]|uniref:kinase-associated lipoprotein B n=1 Tax=Evansella sp. AB-rgal1 TaxID=3242696 RepID=UPI00359E050F